jgi:ectoine hydroxylase
MLSQEQIARYKEDGVLFMPGLFTPREIATLQAEKDRIFALDLPNHLRAQTGEFLGTTVMNRVSPLYTRLLSDERLLGMAEQLLGPELYVHQYKIILKQPFGKLTLPWHQDYGPWAHHDGMPEPRALSISIYLDEVNEFNGPILYIPGSHRHGLIDYEVLPVPGTTPIPSVPNETVKRMVEERGIFLPKGPIGSMTVFDSCTVHASGSNPSPYPRHLIYLSYTPVNNHITRFTRPDHFAAREFVPLKSAPRSYLVDPPH